MSNSHTFAYWLNALISWKILCIIGKIIEYVQESFCSFRNWWPNTGIEIFWLEMHITSVMWYLYILLRKIVYESQITELKGF